MDSEIIRGVTAGIIDAFLANISKLYQNFKIFFKIKRIEKHLSRNERKILFRLKCGEKINYATNNHDKETWFHSDLEEIPDELMYELRTEGLIAFNKDKEQVELTNLGKLVAEKLNRC